MEKGKQANKQTLAKTEKQTNSKKRTKRTHTPNTGKRKSKHKLRNKH